MDILILSENSKGNFVKFGGELAWVDKIHVFLPALLISQKRSGYNGPTPTSYSLLNFRIQPLGYTLPCTRYFVH